jgi:RimJ/RimL family protein N-acetyltransferase
VAVARSARSTIDGAWVRLTSVAAHSPVAIEDLQYRLGLRAEMVAPGMEGTPAGSRFGDATIISDSDSGEMLGIIGNVEIADYPGVAGLVIYVDEHRARTGYAMIAWFRYVDRMFELGAIKVQMEVLSFNTPVHRIMRRIGARPEAVLREHFYIAGRHWDATLYGFDRQAWQAVDRRYRDVVRHPAAVASSRQDPGVRRLVREAIAMKVDYLILADAAIATDGKHYLHGAGWDSLVASSLPVFHRHMSAALRLRLPGTGPALRLGVDVLNPEGVSILAAPIYNDLVPGDSSPAKASDEQAIALVFNFDSLHFAQAGTFAVVVSVDGVELHRTPFYVRTA